MIKNAIPIKKAKIGIKDLPLSSRPREKLLAKGRENLSDEELIAILLGTGSSKQNVLKLSNQLLKQFPLKKLTHISLPELARFTGIGKAKATRLVAAIELGSRLFSPVSFSKIIIRSAEDALVHLRDITNKQQEYIVVFYLNARHELIEREIVGQGGLSSMLITPKEVFAQALKTPCASIIVAHNHPSNDPTPSDDDISFTTRIHEAGVVMGISMLDHLIVAKSSYFSFRENKIIHKS
jgi:DNA repair protein RadC